MTFTFQDPTTTNQSQMLVQSPKVREEAVFAAISSELGRPVSDNTEQFLDRRPLMGGTREFIKVAVPTIATALSGAAFATFSGAGLLAIIACYVCAGNLGLIAAISARHYF